MSEKEKKSETLGGMDEWITQREKKRICVAYVNNNFNERVREKKSKFPNDTQ